MKSLFSVLVVALALTACSSKEKKAEAPAAATPAPAVTAAPVAAPTTTPETKVDKKAKKQKKAKAAAESATTGETAAATTAGTVTCKMGGATRTIEVKDMEKGCEVLYSKDGEAKSVASAKSDKAHCQGVKAKIEKNLTASGFTCQ